MSQETPSFPFDARVTPAGLGVIEPDSDGPIYAIELAVVIGLPIGPGQALPFGQIRIPLDFDSVDGLIDQLTTSRDRMRKPSDIAVASSLQGVDSIAQQQAQFRGK